MPEWQHAKNTRKKTRRKTEKDPRDHPRGNSAALLLRQRVFRRGVSCAFVCATMCKQWRIAMLHAWARRESIASYYEYDPILFKCAI